MSIALNIDPALAIPGQTANAPDVSLSKDGGADFQREMQRTARDNERSDQSDRNGRAERPERSENRDRPERADNASTESRRDARSRSTESDQRTDTRASQETSESAADADATQEATTVDDGLADEATIASDLTNLTVVEDGAETTDSDLDLEETATDDEALAIALAAATQTAQTSQPDVGLAEGEFDAKVGLNTEDTALKASIAATTTRATAQPSALNGQTAPIDTTNGVGFGNDLVADAAAQGDADDAALLDLQDAEIVDNNAADAVDAEQTLLKSRSETAAAIAANDQTATTTLEPAADLSGPDFIATQQTTTQQTVAATPTITGARAAPMAEAAAAQIALAVQRNGGQNEVSIQLDPPELGSLQIRMQFTEQGGLNAVLAIDNDSTRTLMRAHESELRAALAEAGFENAQFQFTEGSGQEQNGTEDARNEAIAYDGGADLNALGLAADATATRVGVKTDDAVDIRV
ncbi:MAG: flagellar hook-length control protein FliK [Pseudomonadota bacterium]